MHRSAFEWTFQNVHGLDGLSPNPAFGDGGRTKVRSSSRTQHGFGSGFSVPGYSPDSVSRRVRIPVATVVSLRDLLNQRLIPRKWKMTLADPQFLSNPAFVPVLAWDAGLLEAVQEKHFRQRWHDISQLSS
jgi:hypothetical protein